MFRIRVQLQGKVALSRTRGKYVPVRSAAASLLLTVPESATSPCFIEVDTN